MTEPPRRTRPVAGHPAAWLEAGSGPRLGLLHGAGGAADLWRRQLDGLGDVARVVAPDLLGHGPLGGRGKPSVAGYAEWLEGFLAVLDAGPVVVVGHSMGGAVALTHALARREPLAAWSWSARGRSSGCWPGSWIFCVVTPPRDRACSR